MANELATDLGLDYEWNDGAKASFHIILEGPWTEQIQSIIGTSTSHTEKTVITENLREFENDWTTTQFASGKISLKKWESIRTATGATSPHSLFLSRSVSDFSFEVLLALVKYGLNRDGGEQLAERLAELKNDLAEDENSPDLSMSSVSGLIGFLRDNPQLRDPGLVASNTGNVRAEWHESWSQHFVVEFTSSTEARFVVFVADTHAKRKVARISVICSVASLMEHAAPHGIYAWAMRA